MPYTTSYNSYKKRRYSRAAAPRRRYTRRSRPKARLGLKYRTNRGYSAYRRPLMGRNGKVARYASKQASWLGNRAKNFGLSVGFGTALYKLRHPNASFGDAFRRYQPFG